MDGHKELSLTHRLTVGILLAVVTLVVLDNSPPPRPNSLDGKSGASEQEYCGSVSDLKTLSDALWQRRSSRKFSFTPKLELVDLAPLLKLATASLLDCQLRIFALSSKEMAIVNASPYSFEQKAIAGSELLKSFGAPGFLLDAPIVLVVTAPSKQSQRQHFQSGQLLQSLSLQFAEKGWGSCIVAGFNELAIKKALILQDERVLYLLPMGPMPGGK